MPLALKIRPAPVATSDDGEIDAAGVAMSWTPPEQRAGPIDLYVVEVQYPAESQSRTINVTGGQSSPYSRLFLVLVLISSFTVLPSI